ncbi:MAG: radical SAM protein [bacterium]
MNINEINISIQGEGKYLGHPALIIRFNGCNLVCPYCDTKRALENNYKKTNPKELANYLFNKYLLWYKQNKLIYPHIMITGGEPLLYLNNIDELLTELDSYIGYDKLFVEIETNGVLLSNLDVLDTLNNEHLIHLNISPKIEPECYKKVTTIENIIETFKPICDKLFYSNINHIYKFVHDKANEDKLLKFIKETDLESEDIYCMAKTPIDILDDTEFHKQLHKNSLETVKFCVVNNFVYTPRDHIYLFGRNGKELEQMGGSNSE